MALIPTFIDISEGEQCEELREYLESVGASLAPKSESFAVELETLIRAANHVLRDDQKDADVECLLNSLVSLLIVSAAAAPAESLVALFCDTLATNAKTVRTATVAARVLRNLFSGLQDAPELRVPVFLALVRLSALAGSHALPDVTKLRQWFPARVVGTERVQSLLRALHEALLVRGQVAEAGQVMVELLATYTEENASEARDDAHKCIVACLQDPNTFLMDHLLTLKPVKFLEGEPIHDLLTIFVADKLTNYIKFYNARKEFVESLGLSHEQNLQKMRLLTFMQMAEGRKEIPFDAIQADLQLSADQVEAFVIDVLRTRLVKAKVDQVNRRVLVSSTMHRTFGRAQWQTLRDTLSKWALGLAQVQHTVTAALHATN